MLRIRIQLPKGQLAVYRHLDLLHDALVNAWTAAGAPPDLVLGAQAGPWNFAALGWHQAREGRTHTLVVSTPNRELTNYLYQLDPAEVRQARASTAEVVDFSRASVSIEPDPIPPGQGVLGCIMLSPLAISERSGQGRRWHKDLKTLDISTAVNHRLSRLTDRSVRLQIQADTLYLRANPDHSVLVSLKGNGAGQNAFVIGMQAPLVLAGPEEDLRLAWYAGIGEKTRSGFGCLGLLQQGVGR